jgi:Fe-S cluster biogenesis protein NfuA/nitrite reductase/ring-hydroxylating ferredoxin subunit
MADPARIEALLEEVDALPAASRAVASELVQELVDLYGEGLARLVAILAAHDEDGSLAAAAAADDVVAHLLLLHGLHPMPLEGRVRRALEEVRPYLESHGGDVELLGVDGGVVRLRLQGSCEGCPSSSATLKLAIEDAIRAAAPDVASIEAEGAAEPAPAPDPARPRRAWASAGALEELDGAPLLRDVEGEAVLFVRLARRVYAYHAACPSCGASLADGVLDGTVLACGRCGRDFDLRRAGRCPDEPALHAEPVPLLVDGEGRYKVALSGRVTV